MSALTAKIRDTKISAACEITLNIIIILIIIIIIIVIKTIIIIIIKTIIINQCFVSHTGKLYMAAANLFF